MGDMFDDRMPSVCVGKDSGFYVARAMGPDDRAEDRAYPICIALGQIL